MIVVACATVGVLLCVCPRLAQAQDAMTTLNQANSALDKGAVRDAIELYERFADQGGKHPDISYNRGVAYLTRYRSESAKPGDLGQAAAAFEESLVMRPGDEQVEHTLDLVRAEVARKRSRQGGQPDVTANTSAWRSVIKLATERTWAYLSLFSALILSIGLVLRRGFRGVVHLAGGVISGIGLCALVVFSPMAGLTYYVRHSLALAVVVQPSAPLLDDKGAPKPGQVVPEAGLVDVMEQKGSLVHVRWGKLDGFTAPRNIRIVRPIVGDSFRTTPLESVRCLDNYWDNQNAVG
jgi:hypothetical protein